jgi:hypothetical protein
MIKKLKKQTLMIKKITLIALTLTFLSCSPKKNKYYYAVNGGELKLIEEYTDSAAYMYAFRYLEIRKKIQQDTDDVLKGNKFYTPEKITYFDLFNEKLENITYTVHFEDEDSLKADAIKDAKNMPNTFKETKQKTGKRK